jgi:uncharacterized membrane protein
MVSIKGFLRGSFVPFFPSDQVREESVNSQNEFRESTFIVNDPKKILMLRLAKGEITKETYLKLLKLISK